MKIVLKNFKYASDIDYSDEHLVLGDIILENGKTSSKEDMQYLLNSVYSKDCCGLDIVSEVPKIVLNKDFEPVIEKSEVTRKLYIGTVSVRENNNSFDSSFPDYKSKSEVITNLKGGIVESKPLDCIFSSFDEMIIVRDFNEFVSVMKKAVETSKKDLSGMISFERNKDKEFADFFESNKDGTLENNTKII